MVEWHEPEFADDDQDTPYVLASDYDAIEAELRDCERRCDEWREQSSRDSALAVCNETLRAELRGLRRLACVAVAHKGNCIFTNTGDCDCGAVEKGVASLAGTEDRCSDFGPCTRYPKCDCPDAGTEDRKP